MKKLDRVFTYLYRIFGTFVFVCFFSYFMKLVISPEGTLPWFATTFMMLFVGLPVIFRKSLRRLLGKAYTVLKGVMCTGFILYFISLAALVTYIYTVPVADLEHINPQTDRVYIVFGAKVKTDGPTSTLAERLNEAARALEKDKNALCIVSGGQGNDEPTTEAYAMKEYLLKLGIAEDRIYMEDKASNTAENIRYSVELMEREGLEDYDIVCVSSDTHIPRISLMCARAGVDAEFIKAESPKKEYLFTTWVREHLSYFKMLLTGA